MNKGREGGSHADSANPPPLSHYIVGYRYHWAYRLEANKSCGRPARNDNGQLHEKLPQYMRCPAIRRAARRGLYRLRYVDQPAPAIPEAIARGTADFGMIYAPS